MTQRAQQTDTFWWTSIGKLAIELKCPAPRKALSARCLSAKQFVLLQTQKFARWRAIGALCARPRARQPRLFARGNVRHGTNKAKSACCLSAGADAVVERRGMSS
ncbi:hypothetical protein niasHT_012399 [Heterodera trifolii]|uniref:Uncharacterized protein n=1 Tax=Heterodera trifolii TaxID=157864 RepID=A0ABD2L722_9BILA